MLAKNGIDAENRVIADKDIEGTKPKKRTDKPSNFVSNKDFNPGSNLILKNLPEDQDNFWIDIFQRELTDSFDPNAMMAEVAVRASQVFCCSTVGVSTAVSARTTVRALRHSRTIWMRRRKNSTLTILSFMA